ncbi:MAG: HPr family phosphocarrier protein [Oscillospiraceae bacterium]|nr:HPr family phosphocarrier protein [Oscillospiraceae bacterium]
MRSVQIKLSAISDIKNFVHSIQKYSADAKLKSGNYMVCARSLMGIFVLDLMKPLELIVKGNDCDPLLNEVSRYIVC